MIQNIDITNPLRMVKPVRSSAEDQQEKLTLGALTQNLEKGGLDIEKLKQNILATKQAAEREAQALQIQQQSGGDPRRAIEGQFAAGIRTPEDFQRFLQSEAATASSKATADNLVKDNLREDEKAALARAEAERKRIAEENTNAEKIAREMAGEMIPGSSSEDAEGNEVAMFRVRDNVGGYRNEQRVIGKVKASTTGKPASVQEYEYAKNQGYKGTYDEYQNMDANRRRQMVNINLEKLRELDLENKTDASPGQVVFKNSGRPVGTALPESAAARLEGIQTAIQQSDVVEKALLDLGKSGAVKGYIEENGVYWPVVQDALTPAQAAAVSETNRLLSAYAQAVSGLAVSEPEIRRLQRSAPSVKLTPEANKVILGHFRRNAIAKRDNYLDIRGWKLKEDVSGSSNAEIVEYERGPDGKLRVKGK